MASWSLAWLLAGWVVSLGHEPLVGVAAGSIVSLGLARVTSTGVRRFIIAGGFPLSVAACGWAGSIPAWTWLVPLGVLLLVYPVAAWRDAPLFPSAATALDGLQSRLNLAADARLLDAGCGLGHGMRALRREWPDAHVSGVERSRILALVCALVRPKDCVRCADMWRVSWKDFDLVYLFQRPESMAQAWNKACMELRPGAWLVSLDFPVPGQRPDVVIERPSERALFAYSVQSTGSTRSDHSHLRVQTTPARGRPNGPERAAAAR